MTTLTLTAKQLAALTAPVVPHASTDKTLPLLSSVLIRTSGQYVTAIATDRYRIGIQRLALDEAPEPGFRAAIPLGALAQIQSIFKPTRMHDPLLSLDSDGETLRVTTADTIDGPKGELAGGLTGATLTFALAESGKTVYPKIDRLVREALGAKPSTEPWTLTANPRFLALFAKGQPIHEPITIQPTAGPNKPWLIRVGADFLGLIVPVRFAGERTAPPSWLDLLDPVETPKEEAA